MTDERADQPASPPQDVLSLIGHELRTPLNCVLGFSQLITMDSEASANVSRWASTTHGAALSLTNMIESLLLFAATDGLNVGGELNRPPGLAFAPTSVALAPLLTSVKADVDAQFVDQACDIITAPASDAGEIVTSERHLRFALGHLVRNAAQYSNANPVRIGATREPDPHGVMSGVHITIEDQGPGIDAAEYARCAQPFARGHGVSGTGLGLGIPLAQRLVTRLGGTISYENPASGPSTFHIHLPSRFEADPEPQSIT